MTKSWPPSPDVQRARAGLNDLYARFWDAIKTKDLETAQTVRHDIETYLDGLSRRVAANEWLISEHRDVLLRTGFHIPSMEYYDFTPEVDEAIDELVWMRHEIEETGITQAYLVREKIEAYIAGLDRYVRRHPAVMATIAWTRATKCIGEK